MPPVLLPEAIPEGASAVYVGTLVDQDGVPIPAGLLATLTLTYYDVSTGVIINGRDTQDILNTNDVTVDSAGALTWTLQPADTAIVATARPTEVHRGLLTWRFGVPLKIGRHEVEVIIENLSHVP